MLRVSTVTNIPTPYNDALYTCVAALDEIDLEVAYCASTEPNRSWLLPKEKKYAYRTLPGRRFGASIHVNPSVVGFLRERRSDVVILSGAYTTVTVQLAAASLEARATPWLYWGEELQFTNTDPWRKLARRLLRRVLVKADGILAIGSRATRSYAAIGVSPQRIVDFRYYPDYERFAVTPSERELRRSDVRQRLSIPADAMVFLYCGQLIYRKGVDILLRACARLKSTGSSATTLIVGDGPDQQALLDLARGLGVENTVRFLGFVQAEDIPQYFAASDVLVLPSRKEGWGIVVSEAMAAGLPVIASDRVNAAADLVVQDQTGYVFAADSHEELARAMAILCAAPIRLAAMSRAATVMAREENPRSAARKLAGVLRSVVARDASLQISSLARE